MKKITLFIAITFTAFSVISQSLSISYQGMPLNTNEVIILDGPANLNEIELDQITISNNSEIPINVMVKKVENYLVTGSHNSFVWGGILYAPWVYISLYDVTIPAGGTTNNTSFMGYYGPNGFPGQSSISYVFFDEGNWLDSVSVDVLYNTFKIDNFPYSESFEGGFDDWLQSLDDDFDWTQWQGITPSNGTGPSEAFHGNYYLYTEASNNNPDSTTGLYTCCDFSGINFPCISYFYNMNGINMGTLKVQVSTNNGTTWLDQWSLTGDQGNVWINNKVDLSAYGNNSNVMIRFWAHTGDGDMSDIAIDLVEIYEDYPPDCTSPVYPNNLEVNVPEDTMLQWSASSNAAGYILYFGTDNPPTNIENGIDIGNTISYSPSFILECGSTYFWQIVPYNLIGNATDCSIWQFETTYNSLDLTVILEGSFNGVDMDIVLNNAGLIPLSQPFDTAPWNYEGTENVAGIPNGDVIDWVLLELRETAGDAYTAIPDSIVARQAAFILSDGQIAGLDGISLPEFDITISDNLYVVLWHRNHLAVMSSSPLTESKGTYQYDFTDDISKAYLDGQKEVVTGNYGMISGDCDGNGIIDDDDKNNTWSSFAGKKGYDNADVNNDGEINNIDKDDYWHENFGNETKVPTNITFLCGDQISDIDGNTYNTIQIGTQCWMKENLNIGTMINTSGQQADNDTIEKYCYDNNIDNCSNYGGLYQWWEMMQYNTTPGIQGICPEGWHLPTEYEWCTVTQFIDPTVVCGHPGMTGTDCGYKMKSNTGWNTGGNGSNVFGFSALPAGYTVVPYGYFFDIGVYGIFWTSTYMSYPHTGASFLKGFKYDSDQVWAGFNIQEHGYSVRCIKN